MDKVVQDLAKNVAERYGRSLAQFRPCKPGGEYLEQNLITLLSHEFMFMFKDDTSCIAYSEIPFKYAGSSKRVDGYLANSQVAYVVEAKSSRSKKRLIDNIKSDLDRIESPDLQTSFIEMASREDTYQFPKDVSGIIIADFWSLKGKTPWFTSSEDFEASLQPYTVSAVREKIGTFGRYDYFLLVAQTKPLGW